MSVLHTITINELKAMFGEQAQTKVSLTELSQWKVGGKAAIIIRPNSKLQLIKLYKYLIDNRLPSLIIGGTTNLLFTDEDIQAVIIQLGSSFSDVVIQGDSLIAQAGVWVPKLARIAMQASLTGLEHTCGIPGTLGGLVVMNGGSQRKGIGSVITYVETINTDGELHRYTAEESNFKYRSSIFQRKNEVISEVGIKLKKSMNKMAIHTEMLSILRSRSMKFPRKHPSCGSVFVSNPAMYEQFGPPGKVIEDCGFKGLTCGGAQVSPLHANFIVNTGNAKSEDILYLINTIRKEVYTKTGYLMQVEAKYVLSQGIIKEI